MGKVSGSIFLGNIGPGGRLRGGGGWEATEYGREKARKVFVIKRGSGEVDR